MDSNAQVRDTNKAIQVPEYFYAVDVNYLTHMIGKRIFDFKLVRMSDISS